MNWDVVDAHTKIISGLSYVEPGANFTNDSGFSNVTKGQSFNFDPKTMQKKGTTVYTVINSQEHLMTTRSTNNEGDGQPQYKFYKWSPK